jgi:hypothetical protein
MTDLPPTGKHTLEQMIRQRVYQIAAGYACEVSQAALTKTCLAPTEKRGEGKVREPGISGGQLGQIPAGGCENRVAFGGTVSPVLFHRDPFKAYSELSGQSVLRARGC